MVNAEIRADRSAPRPGVEFCPQKNPFSSLPCRLAREGSYAARAAQVRMPGVAEDHMGIFSWLLEHGDEERDPGPDDKVLVPPQRARVEEAEVVIVPFGSLRAARSMDD